MTSIQKFDSEIYSEEIYNITESEYEYDEVMSLMAEDENSLQGYSDWSQELENEAWLGSKECKGILIKKACEHTNCPHTRCAKAVRIGGIEI
jgi:hypothetical protein